VNALEVYVNGVFQNASDYTATNGTSVTLGVPATTGDIVEFIALSINGYGATGPTGPSVTGPIGPTGPTGPASALTVDSTPISGGTSGRLVYNNANTFGETATGTGVLTAIGNAVNSASGLVQLNASTQLPAVSGALLTNIPGTWTLIQTLTAGTGLATTNCFSSTYTNYALVFYNFGFAGSGSNMIMEVYSGGSYKTSSYTGCVSTLRASTSVSAGTWSVYAILSNSTVTIDATSSPGYSGIIYLSNPSSTTLIKTIHGYIRVNQDFCACGGGWTGGTGAITGFQVYAGIGTFNNGVIKIYGWN
jgi:hypothetical protein